MLKLKNFRSHAKGLPDLLPWAALIAPDIVLQKDGSLLASYEIRGRDVDSSTPDELALTSIRANAGIMRLGSGWMMNVDAVRLPDCAYPDPEASHFPDPVTTLIEDERRKIFADGNFYSTRTVMSFVYKPPMASDKLTGVALATEAENNALEKALEHFRTTLGELEDIFSTIVRMERLSSFTLGNADGSKGHAGTFSPLLSFLNLCVTGEEQPMLVPQAPMYLDGILGCQEMTGGIAPKIGRKWIAVVALDGLPHESYPAMLSILDGLPLPYRFSTRFLCLDQHEAQKEVDKYRKTWRQQIFKFWDAMFNNPNARPNRDALRMNEDAEEAYADVQSNLMGSGFYTANIVLQHEDAGYLEECCRQIRRLLQGIGFGCRIESINAVEAWLSTHPGNWYANVRRPLIMSMNLADLLPLSTIWPGRQFNPCPFFPDFSPPLMYCATNGSTPFRLNLHVGDLGHTLIFGPTGAGKSTLLATIAAQFRRYKKGTIYAFDKGMSLYALTKASGGLHLDVAGGGSPSFCPLFHLEDDGEIAWAAEWIETLCELQGLAIQSEHRRAIHDALLLLLDNPDSMRSLTDFYHLVSNMEVKSSIMHYTNKGAMGHLLDAAKDNLDLHSFMTFEVEHLMELGDKNLIPVLLYLFHKIEKSIREKGGKIPTILFLDEAWIMLGHPVFRDKIRAWLKVMRKANCAVVLATQSLSDAARSGILDVLVESCLTKILLPNGEAAHDSQKAMYQAIGLNEREISIISTAIPKREYYVSSPEGRRLVNLALGPKTLAFVAASDRESISRIKALESEYGQTWPEEWLFERTGEREKLYLAA